MNPDRQAMIDGSKSPRKDRDRDITAPRYDSSNRIAKPSRHPPPRNHATAAAGRYLTQDQQSEQFIADEDKFVLKQAKKKSDIRVREQRARPIDYLAFGLRFIDPDRDAFDDDEDDVEIQIPSPEAVVQGLNEAKLKELEEDVQSYHSLENNARNKEYWAALLTLCSDRLQKLKPQGPEGRAVTSVASDVDRILSPKTLEQLEALERQIKAKLRSDESIDTDYWEALLKSLLVYKSKATLKNVCAVIKEARVEMLRARDPERASALEASDGFSGGVPDLPTGSSKAVAKPAASTATALASSSAPPPGTARFASAGNEDFSQATKALYDREVARGVGEGEEIFAAEEAVPGIQKPLWADKYRPRKPRYFNRVLMGYEWNKYNQTHYDHDNPPPKVVQGYRFNVFYPDLIDKTKAPTFKIIREHGRRKGESFAPAGKEDTCLIRFIAGPPYEDIAFRIVDREWDYSAKKERGFKSSFDKVRPVNSRVVSLMLLCRICGWKIPGATLVSGPGLGLPHPLLNARHFRASLARVSTACRFRGCQALHRASQNQLGSR
ncbi:mid region of cactin-domain-containing protein [Chaetomium tenue]|uniref:Mid region of cactin-domain-containing protein n=1 Tax=Chaetomium tenue TaxID=1854479 RepID=A0ACB7PU59_9PEZI|nr:mid region of cactin-domain-containing protein [Chaetomium globosum]